MNKCLILPALVAISFVRLAYAQDPTPEPLVPTAPCVARAPDFAAWSVEVTQKKSIEPAPTPVPVAGSKGTTPPVSQKILRRSLVTKTGNILRDIRTFTDGTTAEMWWIHGRILRQDPEQGYINVIDPSIDQSAPQFNSSDFESANWVDLPYFTRSESKRGIKCFVYEWKERMPSEADFAKLPDYGAKSALYYKFRGKPLVPTQAWIDKATRYPVVLEDENRVYTYTYLKPPTEPLTLPAAFQKDWDLYQATLDDWKKHVMPKQQ